MNKETTLKPKLFVISFFVVFFLLYPMHESCLDEHCFMVAFIAAFIFSFNKLSQYDFYKGKAFNGFYTINTTDAKSIKEDSSHKNRMIRYYKVATLFLMDGVVIFVIITKSWLFN